MLPPASDLELVDLRERKILLVDDDRLNLRIIHGMLQGEGYILEDAASAEKGLEKYIGFQPDLVLFDVMLPGMNGFEVLRRYRAGGGSAAVLILSARDQEVDKVQGFRIGADDYVVKPVGVLEFLARVEAIIRRLVPAGRVDGAAKSAPLGFSDVLVDLRTRTVQRGGKAVELSPMEFDFLAFLIESGGDIVSRDTLMRQVWRYSLGVTSRTVDQHVARLRNKLEPDPAQPRHLITVRKAGYRFQR